MYYKQCGALILSIMLVMTATGCARSDGVKTNQYKARSINHLNTVDGTNHNLSTNKVVSEKMAQHVSSVKGVTKATVAIDNRNAVIGIDVKAGEDTAAVARNVKLKAEQAEPGYTVHVTADRNLHTRIQRFHQQMVPLDGHPIHNTAEDIGVIIRDIGHALTQTPVRR
jgi:YhcN/YlaJ family sporulation lipoprotein